MLDIAPSELLLCAVVALVVIGPKDLPRALRFAGKWMGKARKMARHFNAGVDNIIREAELQDLKKEWAEHNKRIMEQFPNVPDYSAVTPEGMLASVMPPDGAASSGPSAPVDPNAPAQGDAPHVTVPAAAMMGPNTHPMPEVELTPVSAGPVPVPPPPVGPAPRMPRAPVQVAPDWSEDGNP